MHIYCKIDVLKAASRSFLFSPPPTPPQKIQITTPFGSNEIILIEEAGKHSPSPSQKAYFTSRHSSLTTSSQNICCLCSNLIPNTLSRSESQIIKNFKMNASPNFTDSKTSVGSSNSSEKIYFKTARSKSYCCQSTSFPNRAPSDNIEINQNFLNASFNVSSNSSECNVNSTKKSSSDRLKYNLSSTSSIQSFASVDDRNKLNLPGKLVSN